MTHQTTRRALMSSGATAALGVAGATVATQPARAAAPLGPNDRRLCEIRDRMRAIYRETEANPDDTWDVDSRNAVLFEELFELQDEALATVPDDARGDAVLMRILFGTSVGRRGNEMGDHGHDYDGGDGDPHVWQVAKTMERKAHAIDPNFTVWPGGV